MDINKIGGFQYLSAADMEKFSRYYQQMDGAWASSLSFASMIAWNQSIRIYHREIGAYLCCLAEDTTCNRWVVLPFFGRYDQHQIKLAMEELISILGRRQQPIIITDVSEWMLPYYLNVEVIKLKPSFDIGLSDYIYPRTDFDQALNRQNSRYNYNYFIRKYQPQLAIMADQQTDSYLHFLRQSWCGSHDCSFCQYGCLLNATENILSAFSQVGARGITVYVNQQMVGYTIVTAESNQLAFHFKETLHGYRGLNEFMHRQCLDLFGSQAEMINYTEDMNLAGLRKYKQSLATYQLHHKYELCGVG